MWLRIISIGLIGIGAVILFGPAALLLVAGWLLLWLSRWQHSPEGAQAHLNDTFRTWGKRNRAWREREDSKWSG